MIELRGNTVDDKSTTTECLSGVVECFAGIGTRIFGEYFGNFEIIVVAVVFVVEVCARLNLFVVM